MKEIQRNNQLQDQRNGSHDFVTGLKFPCHKFMTG